MCENVLVINKAAALILNRYISREVATTLGTIVVVLMLAFLSQQMVRYLNYVVMGKIPTNILLEMVSFEVPYLLALLLPLALYLGIILVYGRLHAENEMIVMQMSGFNQRRLMHLTVALAAGMSLFVLCLMLWVNPAVSSKREQVMASDGATLHLIQTLIPGRFQVSPDGRHVMYVEKLSINRERAENVFMAQAKPTEGKAERPEWVLVSADQGFQESDKKGNDPFFVTTNGYRYEGKPGSNEYKVIQYQKYGVRIPQSSSEVKHLESESLSTSELWAGFDQPNHAAELLWRFSIGLATFLLALLAMPLSTLKPRKSRYMVLLPAVIIYIVYFNMLFVVRHWIEQGDVTPWLGIISVHMGLVAVIGIVMLLRSSYNHQHKARRK